MENQKKRKPRVVSIREYLLYLARKTSLATGSVVMLVLAAMSGLFALLAGISAPCALAGGMAGFTFLPIMLLLAAGAGWGAVALYKSGLRAVEISEQMEPVVLRTRSNVKDLPAEETLVRASQEPAQHLEQELLRAAAAADDSPPEQLLRAHLPGSPENVEEDNAEKQENRLA